jgi:hypothetical protein
LHAQVHQTDLKGDRRSASPAAATATSAVAPSALVLCAPVCCCCCCCSVLYYFCLNRRHCTHLSFSDVTGVTLSVALTCDVMWSLELRDIARLTGWQRLAGLLYVHAPWDWTDCGRVPVYLYCQLAPIRVDAPGDGRIFNRFTTHVYARGCMEIRICIGLGQRELLTARGWAARLSMLA